MIFRIPFSVIVAMLFGHAAFAECLTTIPNTIANGTTAVRIAT